jgi:DNA repair exonuclease SbcCD nuclease subunit
VTRSSKPDVRLVHTSDLHLDELGDRRCQGLTHVVDFALEQRADGLLIAGDFFDANRVRLEVIEFAVAELRRFRNPVIIAAGNHDCMVEDSVYNRGSWPDAANVHVLRSAAGESVAWDHLSMTIWGKPLMDYGDGEGPLVGMPRPGGGANRWQVAIAHGYYQPPGARTWASFPMTAEQIAKSKRDYIALGDSHAFRPVAEGPVTAYYSGAPSSGTHTAALVRFDGARGCVSVERCSLRERYG